MKFQDQFAMELNAFDAAKCYKFSDFKSLRELYWGGKSTYSL